MRAADPPDTVTFRFRGRWEQYGATDVPPDAIFVDFAAGSTFIASPNMDSRLFRGRWAFSQRADDPHDTVAILFRGRWVQYGTLDVPPDAIIADFAAGSAFIASHDMDSRHFRGRWEDSMKQLIHNILIKRLIVAKEGIYCFLAGKYRQGRGRRFYSRRED